MVKVIFPGDGSIWERNQDGARFEVVTSEGQDFLLRATATGRKHWVTQHGLGQKYTWISDAEEGHEHPDDSAAGM